MQIKTTKLYSATILLLILLFSGISNAQITFDKKSGMFNGPAGPVAKLTDEKVKAWGGKNYFIMDPTGQTELLAFTLHRFEDTLGDPIIWYYSIRCNPMQLHAFRPNFTGSLNTFKEVGELVVSNNLLQSDGKINEAPMQAYFTATQNEMGDFEQRLQAMQDSIMLLVNIPAAPIERNTRKEITANEFGKIGQGNAAIGTWEFIETKGAGISGSTYQFRIKNSAGGIICISWIELSGTHTYIFKNGTRSDDDWQVPDFIHNNPIHNQEAYVVQLATRLVNLGLL